MPKLGIMVGLPRSGKSTYCRENLMQDNVVVCPDKIRLALHGQQFVALAEKFVWAVADTMVRTLLMQGHNVVIDATNVSRFTRSSWSRLATEFDTKLDIYWVTTPAEVCIARNIPGSEGYLHEDTIQRMSSDFQAPSDAEGNVVRINTVN